MKKIILASLSVLMLSACQPTYSDETGKYILPPALKDCTVHELSGSGTSRNLIVVKCPNAQTTTTNSCGKGCVNNTTLY